MPGLVIIGEIADSKYLFKSSGALQGMKVLFAGSESLQDKARNAIADFGGTPIIMPMIKLQPLDESNEK